MASRGMMIRWLLLVAGLMLAGCSPRVPPGMEAVEIKGHRFVLEVAKDDHARAQGLMHRESIPEYGGMLFIFPEAALRAFWMGNCKIDIDIIFLDARGIITATHRMKKEGPPLEGESDIEYELRLPRYPSRMPAQFAIELRAGWLDKLDLKPEDRIELDLTRLKALAE